MIETYTLHPFVWLQVQSLSGAEVVDMMDIQGGEVLNEVKRQLLLAGPLFSIGLLQYSLQIISLMFVGHLGELALAAASMATSFVSVTGFSLLVSSISPQLFLDMYSFVCVKSHLGWGGERIILYKGVETSPYIRVWKTSP